MENYFNEKILRERIESLLREREGFELTATHDYVVHYVGDCYEHLPSIHTHGFRELYNQPNIEITISLTLHVAEGIFDLINKMYSDGKTIEPYKYYRDIIKNYSVMFVEAMDITTGEKTLRLLLPDVNGRMPYDPDVSKVYKYQLTEGCVNTEGLFRSLFNKLEE